MLRRTEKFAFLGIALSVAGIALYFSGSSNRISLVYWLGGPFLWFTGFAIVVGAVAARWLPGTKNTSSSSGGRAPNNKLSKPVQRGDR